MNIKYSVILPVYNTKPYLEECVDSILCTAERCQELRLELIFVDDGSKDGSGDLCDALAEVINAKKAEQITARVIHQENQGAASARNRGIEVASGQYLIFIDSDDTVDECFFETVDHHINEETQLLIFGMAFDYYRSKKIIRTEMLSTLHEGIYKIKEINDLFDAFFADNALSSSCNKVFDANIIKEKRLSFDEKIRNYEDLHFVMQYLLCIDSAQILKNTLYHYRNDVENNRNITREMDTAKYQNDLEQVLSLIILLDKKYANNKATVLFLNIYIACLINSLLSNNYSRNQLKEALKRLTCFTNFESALCETGGLSKKNNKLYQMLRRNHYKHLHMYFAYRKEKVIMRHFGKKVLKTDR